jgi:hypothetical protein
MALALKTTDLTENARSQGQVRALAPSCSPDSLERIPPVRGLDSESSPEVPDLPTLDGSESASDAYLGRLLLPLSLP